MFRVKFFTATNMAELQTEINVWLKGNKDISVFQSNLVLNNSSLYFYILYTSKEPSAEELAEIATTASSKLKVEAKDINPEILDPTS